MAGKLLSGAWYVGSVKDPGTVLEVLILVGSCVFLDSFEIRWQVKEKSC